MTKYILHGGFAEGKKQEDDKFFQEILRDTIEKPKILLVYFAKEDDRIAKNSEEDIEQFRRNGQNKEPLFTIATEKLFKEQIRDSDIIYLHGGHSGKLLETLVRFSNLTELFKGKIVAGDSAGANVLCSYFFSLRIGAHKGLGIIPVKILAHYKEENKHQLDELEPGLPTLQLPELEYKVYEISDQLDFSRFKSRI